MIIEGALIKMKSKYQVFISSTFKDLKNERQAAVQAILRAGHIPAGMELFKASDKSQWEIIKNWIKQSDIYVLILGAKYGSIEPKSGLSYTELEYDYAVSLGKPFFSIVIDDNAINEKVKKEGIDVLEKNNIDKLNNFRKKVLQKMSYFFTDSKDIKLAITESIDEIIKQTDLQGWVRYEDYLHINEKNLSIPIDKNPTQDLYSDELYVLENTLKDTYEFNSVNIGKKIREIWIFFSHKTKQEFALFIGVNPEEIDNYFQGLFIIDYTLLQRIIKLYNLPSDFFVKPTYNTRFAIWKDDIIKYAIFTKIKPKIDISKITSDLFCDIIWDLAKNVISFSDLLYPQTDYFFDDSKSSSDNKLQVFGPNIQHTINILSTQYYKILEQCNHLEERGRLEHLLSKWFFASDLYISRLIHESIRNIKLQEGKVKITYNFWEDVRKGKVTVFTYDKKNQKVKNILTKSST